MLDKINNFGYKISGQLLIFAVIVVVLELFSTFEMDYYVNLEVITLISVLLFAWFNRFEKKNEYLFIGLLVLSSILFALTYFVAELEAYSLVFLFITLGLFSSVFGENGIALKNYGYKKFLSEFFQFSLVVYLCLLLINEFIEIEFLELNYVLGVVVVLGVLSVVFEDKSVKTEENISVKDYVLSGILGIVGAGLIFIKTSELGWVSYAVSIIAGVLIVLVSILVLDEDSEKEYEPKKDSPKHEKVKKKAILDDIVINKN